MFLLFTSTHIAGTGNVRYSGSGCTWKVESLGLDALSTSSGLDSVLRIRTCGTETSRTVDPELVLIYTDTILKRVPDPTLEIPSIGSVTSFVLLSTVPYWY